MSDASEKPFEATPQRLKRAQREGDVVRSSELPANLSFAAAWLTVSALTPSLAAAARTALLPKRSLVDVATACALVLAAAMLPVAAAAAAAVAAKIGQSGFVTSPIGFKLERLGPLAGFRRILSAETLAHSLRAVLAFAAAAGAMAPVIIAAVATLPGSAGAQACAIAAWRYAGELALAAVAVGSLFSIAEYGAARRRWLQKLRMTFEERKREAREEEGDAVARGRRRALHRSFARGRPAGVRDADFVVTNPEHVAVALAYRPPAIAVPRILIRALDAAALEVRAAAMHHDVPIVENVVLARALYRDGRAGQPIPHAHYVAVAEVVTALLRSGALGS